VASLFRRDSPDGAAIALLGLPDDLGVALNHGRTGAREGPAAFRAALARYGVAQPTGWDWPTVYDAGDVTPAEGRDPHALHETHARITSAVHAILDRGMFPIAVGGGHDLTLPFVRAVIEHEHAHGRSLHSGLYFDAHLDVRDTPGSGMAFRRLVEDCGVRDLAIVGLNPAVNARHHHDWFLTHGGRVIDAADAPAAPDLPCFVSFDLDALDAAHAPGVSAINPAGMTVREAQRWVHALARRPNVKCFDLMELCPPHDPQGRTARVAAHLFLAFLRGWSERAP
jgi:formiminoglutamase